MIGQWARLLTFSLVCAIAACAPELGDTAILVTVDSDFAVPEEIDRITLEVPGIPEGADEPSADLRDKALPRSIALRYAGGPYGPLRVVISAYHGDTRVVQKIIDTAFLPGIQSTLAVNLARGCASVFCAQGLSCSDGACLPVSGVEPSAGNQDAGAQAGSDASSGPPLNDAGVANFDASVGPQDSGVRLDAGARLDASNAADAGSPTDASSGSDARAATDTGVVSDAGGALSDSGVVRDSAAPAPSAGATPVCSISRPAANDTLLTGVTFALQGSCFDAESGLLSTLVWASSVDGPLALGASGSATLRTVGAHDITLCAPDPRDARVVGCATVRVNATTQPTARILSVRQGSRESEPLVAGRAITIQGTATGTGVTLRWRDNLQGSLGTGSTVLLSAPLAGRHVVTLDVTDQYGLTASASRAFVVAPTL